MIELFRGYLDNHWRTRKECLEWYQRRYHTELNERVFRSWVEKYNRKYSGGDTEMFVAHSGRGYMLTCDIDVIRKSLKDDYKRAMKLLKRNYSCMKALAEKDQLQLEENEADLYEVVMKMEGA